MDNVLHLVGISRRAGHLAMGEDPVGEACRGRSARLVLTAADAAENTIRRAQHFAEEAQIPHLATPYTKRELGEAMGRNACAMAAVTDIGLAAALAEKLALADPETCGEAAALLRKRADKALARQKEQRRHEKKLEAQHRKPWAAPAKATVNSGRPRRRKKGPSQ